LSSFVVAPVTLTGSRVRLEPLAPEHLDGLWAAAAVDPTIFRWFVAPLTSRSAMATFIAEAVAAADMGNQLPFAVIDRGGTGLGTNLGAGGRAMPERVVGSTRFGAIEPHHRRAEIGWTWIGAPWQRTGINREAKHLMLRHAFETWGLHRVEFKTDALNQQSRNALKRLGAVEEGTFRRHMVVAGGRVRDSVWFSITDQDWPTLSRGKLPHSQVRDECL